MKTLKNMAVTISARVEQFALKFENHNAIAASMIEEMEKAVAKVKVQLGEVRCTKKRIEEKRLHLVEDEQRWIARTKKNASIDERKAIECVRRVKQVKEMLHALEIEYTSVQQLELKLAENLYTIERNLDEVRRRKNDLATRQCCVEALQTTPLSMDGLTGDLGDLFVRWETDIVGKEIRTDVQKSAGDLFNDEFSKAEENEALQKMLHEIMDDTTATAIPPSPEHHSIGGAV